MSCKFIAVASKRLIYF